MPQPINRIVSNPEVYLKVDILQDKPDFAILVAEIFSVWARIEIELSYLLVRVLGADAAPAIAMYSTLTAQHLQLGALQAAAKAALAPDDFDVFLAALAVSDRVQTPRNHLGHWAWGGCRQRPDLLVLANPKMLRERNSRVLRAVQKGPLDVDPVDIAAINLFDDSEILAYSKSDLERALRDLAEAKVILELLSDYLDPSLAEFFLRNFPDQPRTREQLRDEILKKLNDKRLFREVLAERKSAQP